MGSTTETATALTAALAGGKVPDLVMIQGDDLPKFVENPSNFLDLRTLGGDDVGEPYLPWAMSAATGEDGSVIGIPTDVGGLAFAYRTDLFEAAGLPTEPAEVEAMWETWDDFIAMGEQYTAATGEPFVDNVETTVFFSAVNQVSQKYYSDDGELDLRHQPRGRGRASNVAVDTQRGRHQRGNRSVVLRLGSRPCQRRLRRHDRAVLDALGIETDAPDTAGLWRVATVPGVGGNWGGSVIAIPARAENPEGAWQYIQAMLSPEGQEEHFAETGTFPAATAALESEEVRSYTNDFYGDSAIGEVMSDLRTAVQRLLQRTRHQRDRWRVPERPRQHGDGYRVAR